MRTSDWEIPNCRAMRDGVMPALKAARTAFSFPDVNGTAITSARRLGGLSPDTGSFLPRRFRSASTAASNRSSSSSSMCLSDMGRFLGKAMCGSASTAGDDEEEGFADGEDGAVPGANRSGVEDRLRTVPIVSLPMPIPCIPPGAIMTHLQKPKHSGFQRTGDRLRS